MIWMGFQRCAAYLPLTLAVRQILVRPLLVAIAFNSVCGRY